MSLFIDVYNNAEIVREEAERESSCIVCVETRLAYEHWPQENIQPLGKGYSKHCETANVLYITSARARKS